MKAATASTAGAAGLVPAPAAGKQASFLRGDGTWVVPTNTTYGLASTTANGAIIADDPGTTGEFVWSITISNVPANVSIEELVATLSVTAAGGQKAQVTITQAAGDSTLEIDKETINLDVNGSAQTVNVTSNDEWTWKNAASRTVMRMLGRL